MVSGENQINLIFDMIVPHGYQKDQETALLHLVMEKIHHLDSRYQCVITAERSFVEEQK